ncbi:uncharacterized protein LOC123699339 [Colias croceus]|uniref:uncharacterized protein LOC123699339 n=1 Tax=Colias crocea TaxID=72248 RepID=UPI001E27EE7F|nr:uncharacterized protein LOC123699339 [Colias croceus]
MPLNAQGRLEALEALLEAAKEDNEVCQRHLPGAVRAALRGAPRALGAAAALLADRLPLFAPAPLAALRRAAAATLLRRARPPTVQPPRALYAAALALAEAAGRALEAPPNMVDVIFDAIDDESELAHVLGAVDELECGSGASDLSREACVRSDFAILKKISTVDEDAFGDCSLLNEAFVFITRNVETLVEFKLEDIVTFLCRVVESTPVDIVWAVKEKLSTCLRALGFIAGGVPRRLADRLEERIDRMPLDDIAAGLEAGSPSAAHESAVSALRGLLEAFGLRGAGARGAGRAGRAAPRWLALAAAAPARPAAPALADLAHVALRFMSSEQLTALLEDTYGRGSGAERELPGAVLAACVLAGPAPRRLPPAALPDLVLHAAAAAHTHCDQQTILHFIEQVWPTFELDSTFDQRHIVVAGAGGAGGAGAGSAALRWAARAAADPDTPLQHRLLLLQYVPEGESYEHSSGARVSALAGAWAARALGALRVRPRAPHERQARLCLLDYVRAFTLLTLIFDKVPRSHLESPQSPLHAALEERPREPFELPRSVAKLCVALRDQAPRNDGLVEMTRVFHIASLRCLLAALRARGGPAGLLRAALCERVWARLVPAAPYRLPQPHWNREPADTKKAREVMSTNASGTGGLSGPSGLSGLSGLSGAGGLSGPSGAGGASDALRSRLFLTTLSENPLLYDLHDERDEFR